MRVKRVYLKRTAYVFLILRWKSHSYLQNNTGLSLDVACCNTHKQQQDTARLNCRCPIVISRKRGISGFNNMFPVRLKSLDTWLKEMLTDNSLRKQMISWLGIENCCALWVWWVLTWWQSVPITFQCAGECFCSSSSKAKLNFYLLQHKPGSII